MFYFGELLTKASLKRKLSELLNSLLLLALSVVIALIMTLKTAQIPIVCWLTIPRQQVYVK